MNHKINPLHHQQLPLTPTKKAPKQNNVKTSFKSVLEQATQDIKVSKHAQKRLNERNIVINDQMWNEISEKMNEAKQKGVTDSAIILKDAVLVANTKNNTVVTAMDRQNSQLITNVNGTIILQNE